MDLKRGWIFIPALFYCFASSAFLQLAVIVIYLIAWKNIWNCLYLYRINLFVKMAAIKNIIFDLGGVLLNIDFDRTKKAFERLGVKDFDSFYTKETANPVFEALETGQISNEDFYRELQRYCHTGTRFDQIQEAWNEILVDFRKESISHLKTLQKNYNLYLLSNTNRIHHAAFTGIFKSQFPGGVLDNNFKKAWYSHEIQRRKPYTETYLYVINEAGIDPSATLFIDDANANIEGAATAGLQTKLLSAGERIEHLDL